MTAPSQPLHLFLVGCPRSGTTLLQTLLAAHPELFSFPETHLFPRLRAKSGLGRCLGLASKSGVQNLLRDLPGLRIGSQNIDLGPLTRSLFAARIVKNLVRTLDETSRRQGGRGWLEKTPRHLHFIDMIGQMVPAPRFVHLLRSGEDVVASLFQTTHAYPESWGGALTLEDCVVRWSQDVTLSLGYLSDDAHYHLRYETLIAEPEASLRALFEELGLSYESDLLEMHEAGAGSLILSGEEWKNNNFQKVMKKRDRVFDQVFDEEQKQRVREQVAETQAKLDLALPC